MMESNWNEQPKPERKPEDGQKDEVNGGTKMAMQKTQGRPKAGTDERAAH